MSFGIDFKGKFEPKISKKFLINKPFKKTYSEVQMPHTS